MFFFFFFNDTATTEIYPLSLHDALPIYALVSNAGMAAVRQAKAVLWSGTGATRVRVAETTFDLAARATDRKSTRLNSSHGYISYAVFCLKKKKKYARTVSTHMIDATLHY